MLHWKRCERIGLVITGGAILEASQECGAFFFRHGGRWSFDGSIQPASHITRYLIANGSKVAWCLSEYALYLNQCHADDDAPEATCFWCIAEHRRKGRP